MLLDFLTKIEFKQFLSLILITATVVLSPYNLTEPNQALATSVPQTINYTASTDVIANPDRGFWQAEMFFGNDSDALDTSTYLNDKHTLSRLWIRLDSFRDSDIPETYLTNLNNYFQLVRNTGIKVMPSATYNWDPDIDGRDASLSQVLRHINQLAPIYESNKDVITAIEAGFIGQWGEWHSSTNGLDTPQNMITIRDALLEHFPKDLTILFRYPQQLTSWYPSPLSQLQAFNQSNQARSGHKNDCFLASDEDWGTYLTSNQTQWKAYLSQMNRFVLMSGETCNYNPSRSDCPTALQELELMRWTSINYSFEKQVIQSWKNQGCYNEIQNRLGYRLSLAQASFSSDVTAGSSSPIQVNLENTGFASPMHIHPVHLLLVDQGGAVIHDQITNSVDVRTWEPGTHSFTANFTPPSTVPAGQYSLVLWLPDNSVNLQNNPSYSIQLANDNIWDSSKGWNTLGNISISGSSL